MGSNPIPATNMEEKMQVLYADNVLQLPKVVNEKGIKKEQIVSIVTIGGLVAVVYYGK